MSNENRLIGAGSAVWTRGRGVLVPLLLGLLVLALVPERSDAQRRCASLLVDGQRTPVYATALSCSKARRIALRFARDGKFVRGWTGVNPAGCEWVLMRRRDKEAVVANGYQGGPGRPTVSVTRYRGCRS